jgi:hypothetical protein
MESFLNEKNEIQEKKSIKNASFISGSPTKFKFNYDEKIEMSMMTPLLNEIDESEKLNQKQRIDKFR